MLGKIKYHETNIQIYFKSPVGKGLIGKNVGDMVTISTPSGEKNYEILKVEYI